MSVADDPVLALANDIEAVRRAVALLTRAAHVPEDDERRIFNLLGLDPDAHDDEDV
jgi:hypothetical protein